MPSGYVLGSFISFSSGSPSDHLDSSPFGDGSIRVAPDWVAPTMAVLTAFYDIALVDLYT
jgi:hypothetical protein